MQTVTPVNVHVDNEWHNGRRNGSYARKSSSAGSRGGRQAVRMRTCVATKTKAKSPHIPPQVVQPKQCLPTRSQSSSPNREHW